MLKIVETCVGTVGFATSAMPYVFPNAKGLCLLNVGKTNSKNKCLFQQARLLYMESSLQTATIDSITFTSQLSFWAVQTTIQQPLYNLHPTHGLCCFNLSKPTRTPEMFTPLDPQLDFPRQVPTPNHPAGP